jgi:hypothetical protein
MSRMSGSENDAKGTHAEEMEHGGAPDAGELQLTRTRAVRMLLAEERNGKGEEREAAAVGKK